MAGNVNWVADWIKSLDWRIMMPSLNVVSTDAIPETVHAQDCPMLAPQPGNFVSDVTYERLSGRHIDGRRAKLSYTLTYVYYHAPVAEGVSLFEGYRAALDAWSEIVTMLVENEDPTGAYDIRPTGTPAFGPVTDGAGNVFHGFRLALAVIEFS